MPSLQGKASRIAPWPALQIELGLDDQGLHSPAASQAYYPSVLSPAHPCSPEPGRLPAAAEPTAPPPPTTVPGNAAVAAAAAPPPAAPAGAAGPGAEQHDFSVQGPEATAFAWGEDSMQVPLQPLPAHGEEMFGLGRRSEVAEEDEGTEQGQGAGQEEHGHRESRAAAPPG